MINSINANNFCCEDISLIENYKLANNDTTQTWDLHHRLETDLGLSRDELKEQNRYFNVPASELIFLTHSEHQKLHSNERWRDPKEHQKQSTSLKGRAAWNKGIPSSEETKKKQSASLKRENNPNYGIHYTWMNNGIIRVKAKTQEEIDCYTSLGYHSGFKLK